MTLEQFIAALRTRSYVGAAGIGFAAGYISTLGMSPKGLAAQLGVTPDAITQAIKDAGSKLVWTDPGAGITAGALKQTDGGILLFGDSKEADADRKQIGDSAIMRFENILTTKQTDRDGDDLDPKGADVDPKAPLLWQHLPDAPIGKLYAVTERNGDFVKTACGIADTVLGRDAAVLAEFGALRISHGFKPTEFSPKGHKADGEDGWNITKYHVMEVSLVSIPSNTGAVITALHRGKLHAPAIKGYAAALDAARPKLYAGNWNKAAADAGLPQGVTINIHNAPAAAVDGSKAGKPPAKKEDEPPADDPKDDQPPGDDDADKNAPAAFREVLDAVKALAKDKGLPAEAQARAGLVYSMLKEAGDQIAAYMKQIAEAGKGSDVAGVMAAAAEMAEQCHALLARASDEMSRVGEVAGISDAAAKSIGSARDAVATIVAALDDLHGGTTATDPGADEPPPVDPVDEDENGDGNPPADDDSEEGADETEDDETEDENGTETDYNADVSGDSTSGADAESDDTDDEEDKEGDDDETEEKGGKVCRDCGRSMTDEEMSRPNVRCPNCGGHLFRNDDGTRDADDDETEEKDGDDEDTDEKDGEVSGGAANPEVDDEANPGDMTDEDKAAAKSLADLFGEPGVTYDRATLNMLRDLTATAR